LNLTIQLGFRSVSAPHVKGHTVRSKMGGCMFIPEQYFDQIHSKIDSNEIFECHLCSAIVLGKGGLMLHGDYHMKKGDYEVYLPKLPSAGLSVL
jgi:hypothetical protein